MDAVKKPQIQLLDIHDGNAITVAMHFDCLLRGGTLITPGGLLEADLGIRAGQIADIGALKSHANEIIDVHGLHNFSRAHRYASALSGARTGTQRRP